MIEDTFFDPHLMVQILTQQQQIEAQLVDCSEEELVVGLTCNSGCVKTAPLREQDVLF